MTKFKPRNVEADTWRIRALEAEKQVIQLQAGFELDGAAAWRIRALEAEKQVIQLQAGFELDGAAAWRTRALEAEKRAQQLQAKCEAYDARPEGLLNYDPMDDQDNAYDTWKDKQLEERAAAGSDEPSAASVKE